MTAVEVYRVESVETSQAPAGGSKGEWCRYVLASGSSRIVGRYCGSLAKARSNAEALASSLNERVRSGKSPGTPRSRAKRSDQKSAAN